MTAPTPERRSWDFMPMTSRVFTALLVYSMGLCIFRGQVCVIDGVQQGVINMFRPR